MSSERKSGQGYAPIPQNMSNSDTEDEEQRLSIPIGANSNDSGEKRDGLETQANGWSHGEKEMRNFGKDPMENQSRYRFCGDEIPIMIPDTETQDDFWKRRDMSLIRRFCLVLSILLCISTVLVFLYALPCDNAAICPTAVENRAVVAWDKTLEGIELLGPISVVHGAPYSLIFLYRGQEFGANGSGLQGGKERSSEGTGVLSMQGNTGIPLWWVPLKKMPREIDCATFDTDGSGNPDCIVTGQDLLVSLDPTAGTIHWIATLRTNPRMPLLVPDVDSDGIDDLLSVTSLGYPQGGIILISGRDGKFLGEFSNEECRSYSLNSIRLRNREPNYDVSYSCKDRKTKEIMNLTVALDELLHQNGSNLAEPKFDHTSNVSSDAGSQNFDDGMEKTSHYSVELSPYYRLNVENSGVCPGPECRVSVNVTLQRKMGDAAERTIWNRTSENTFAPRPAVYSKSDEPYVTGFAMKFWQWEEKEKGGSSTWGEKGSSPTRRRLTERVLMVFLNYTDVHEINASQSDIVEICGPNNCQPNFRLQSRSIAIEDLGADGTWELINYQSTYNEESGRAGVSRKILTSRVQIVKLDTVLAQLTQNSIN